VRERGGIVDEQGSRARRSGPALLHDSAARCWSPAAGPPPSSQTHPSAPFLETVHAASPTAPAAAPSILARCFSGTVNTFRALGCPPWTRTAMSRRRLLAWRGPSPSGEDATPRCTLATPPGRGRHMAPSPAPLAFCVKLLWPSGPRGPCLTHLTNMNCFQSLRHPHPNPSASCLFSSGAPLDAGRTQCFAGRGPKQAAYRLRPPWHCGAPAHRLCSGRA
jgi:hypothetical protein